MLTKATLMGNFDEISTDPEVRLADLYLARRDGTSRLVGALALEIEVRPEARQAIAELRQLGIRKIAMITGDARPVADAVAADLGFRPGGGRGLRRSATH